MNHDIWYAAFELLVVQIQQGRIAPSLHSRFMRFQGSEYQISFTFGFTKENEFHSKLICGIQISQNT